MKALAHSIRNLFVILTLVVASIFISSRALGDDIPQFSDPDVTAFVKTYAQFTSDYVEACKAVKAGDNSKMTALQSKAPEIQAQAAQVSGKVKADEAPKFQAFVSACAQKIVDAMKELQQ
jgi:galactose-1-phosphate uridylyltransferase